MFKKPVFVLNLELASTCLVLASCGLVDSTLPADIQDELRVQIANDLAQEISSRVPAHVRPIVVRSKGQHAWLAIGLTHALSDRAYGVADTGEKGIQADVRTSRVGPELLKVAIDLGTDMRIDRLYHLERSKKSNRAVKVPGSTPAFQQLTTKRLPASPLDFFAEGVSKATPTIETVAAPLDAPSKKREDCDVHELQPGSLKQNLVRVLTGCGWRLAAWPIDPTKSGYELDWVVNESYVFEPATLQELAFALERAFPLKVDLDLATKTARFVLDR